MFKKWFSIFLSFLMVITLLPLGGTVAVKAASELAAPTNLTATQWGYDLYLNWEPVENAVSYRVEGKNVNTARKVLEPVKESDSPTEFIATISLKVGGGPYNNTYYVYAIDGEGNESAPATVSGTWETGVSFSGRIQASAADVYYTGGPVTTTFILTDIGRVPVTEDDYTVEYRNNVEVGNKTAVAILTGKKGTRFYDSQEVRFSILQPVVMTYDTAQGGFILKTEQDICDFANIVAGVSKRNNGYTVKDRNGDAYAGSINIKGIVESDISIQNTIKFTETEDKVPGVLDLNGHTITGTSDYIFELLGVDLTIKSGTGAKGVLKKTSGISHIIDQKAGATLALENIKLDAGDASSLNGFQVIWTHDGTVSLDNCDVLCKYGEGIYTDGADAININNSNIDTYNAAVFSYEGDINVSNSTIKSKNNRAIFSDPNNRKTNY